LSALAFSLLGCFRAASHEYYLALKEDPDDPVVAHNLGHLLHVKLANPRAALRWLAKAHAQLPEEPEVAASFAYALVANGAHERAIAVLSNALGSRSLASDAVARWTEANPSSPKEPRAPNGS
jgi:tetratricopeptide (TPR) repeat protein